ncbi:MAG: YkgJ family cysteine cluster protein [Desulfurivibrionaceae bacterium]
MNAVYRKGFAFAFNTSACRECPGYCCCGESGNIWVSHEEVKRISIFLEKTEFDFINDHLTSIDNRFSLKEYYTGESFACTFFDDFRRVCRIYPVRPSQCSRYPFWEYFRGRTEQVMAECPGVVRLLQVPV